MITAHMTFLLYIFFLGAPTQHFEWDICSSAHVPQEDNGTRAGGNFTFRNYLLRVDFRFYFFALGNPVIGDKLYKIKTKATLTSSQILLQASAIEFIDEHGEKQTFKLDLPENFRKVVAGLK